MKFILYCLCGGIGVTVDLASYLILLKFGFPYLSANALGYLFGTMVSFLLNRKITFGVADKIAKRLALFLAVALVGFSSSFIILWVLVDMLTIDNKIAKIITLPFVVITQYILNKKFTFNTKYPEEAL